MNDFFKNQEGLTVSDYSIYKSLIFSELNLAESRMLSFRKKFEEILPKLRKPDLIIHLSNSTKSVKERIQNRGRAYETNIEENYLSNIEKGYLKYWQTHEDLNVLIIEPSKIEFPYSKKEIIKLLDYLQKTEIKGLKSF